MDTKKLSELANYDFTNFIQSENNVKYKIVIPFLQAFNYKDLDFEHAAQGSRIDINIGNRIIVETKALKQNLNNHIQQLSNYCGKEWAVLAILTNGQNFKIYSPQWRYQRTFSDKLIYSFELTDLYNEYLVNRLEKIIGYSNYKNGEFLKHIEEREKEILKVNKEIDELKSLKSIETEELKNELNQFRERLKEISDQTRDKEKFLLEFETKKNPKIETLISDYFIPKTNHVHTPNIPIRISSTINTNKHEIGERLIIKRHKNKILAYGHLLDNNNFKVLKGSIISTGTAPKFQTSTRKAYNLRNQYLQDGTINSDRQFIRDVEFNSTSLAASVIMGDSKNGNKEWKKE